MPERQRRTTVITFGTPASNLVRARSARHAQDAWGRLVDTRGERGAFAELAAHAGGSDAAYRTLNQHGITTDLS
jgi:hypothetical protein